MSTFSMTCSCGDVKNVEANDRDEAVTKLKEIMTPEIIEQHMAEKHPGEVVPSVDAVHSMIDENTIEA